MTEIDVIITRIDRMQNDINKISDKIDELNKNSVSAAETRVSLKSKVELHDDKIEKMEREIEIFKTFMQSAKVSNKIVVTIVSIVGAAIIGTLIPFFWAVFTHTLVISAAP